MADVTLWVDGTSDVANHRFTTLAGAVAHAASDHGNFNLTQGCIFIYITSTATDTAPVSVTGFTNATASRYVDISCVSSAKHLGLWGTTYKYRLQRSTIGAVPLHLLTPYTRVTGLQIGHLDTSTSGASAVVVSEANCLLVDCIIRCDNANTAVDAAAVRTAVAPATVTLRNCVIQGTKTGASALYAAASTTITAQNCTIYVPNASSCAAAGTGALVALTNCYLGGPASVLGSGNVTLAQCATSDTSALDPSLRSIAAAVGSGAYFTNVTAGSENFKVTSAASPLVAAGQDLSATFTSDLLGRPRIGWDIGAYEKLVITASHPRIWLTADRLATLQARCATLPSYYTTFKAYYDAKLLVANQGDDYQYNTWYQYLMAYALLYRITGNATYGNEGVVYLKALLNDFCGKYGVPEVPVPAPVGNGRGEDNLPASYLPYGTVIAVDQGYVTRGLAAVSIGRDWLDGAPDLDAATIALCATRMTEWIPYAYDTSVFRNDYGENYGAGHFSMLSTAVFGLYGDAGYDAAWESRLAYAWSRIKTALEEYGGDFTGGYSYGVWTILEWLGYPEMFKTATGSSAEWSSTTFHSDFVDCLMHSLHPSRQYLADHGRWPSDNKGSGLPAFPVVAFLADRAPLTANQTGMARWFVANTFGGTLTTTDILGWATVCYHDASATTVAPSLAILGSLTRSPTTTYRRAATRSADWPTTLATYVEMQYYQSPWFELNQKADFGVVKIASRGVPLVVNGSASGDLVSSQENGVPLIAGSHIAQPQSEMRPDGSETWVSTSVDGQYAYHKAGNYHVLYNTPSASATYGSRSVVFLVPDLTLVYDNFTVPSAATNTFKERWIFDGSPVAAGQVVRFVKGAGQVQQTYITPTVVLTTGQLVTDWDPTTYYVDALPAPASTSNQVVMAFETMDATATAAYTVTHVAASGAQAVYVEKGTAGWIVAWTSSTTGAAQSGVRDFDVAGLVSTATTITLMIADLTPGATYTLTQPETYRYLLTPDAVGTLTVNTAGLLVSAVLTPTLGHISVPYQDTTKGLWTPSVGADLWDMLDEAAPVDTDLITSSATPDADTVWLAMTPIAEPTSGEATMVVRAKRNTPPPAQVALSFEDVTASTNLQALMVAWKAEADALGLGWWPSEVAAGDFTGSGRPDLVLSQHVTGGPGSRIFTNTGLVGGIPQFADYTVARTLGGTFRSLNTEGTCHVLDLNNDGYPDILTIGATGSYRALNNGSGSFTVSSQSAIQTVQMHAGDATGGGRIDLIDLLASFSVYTNNGDGTYTATSAATVGEWIGLTAAMTLPAMAGLLYPRCRKASFGTVLGELVVVSFGEGAYGGTQNTFVLRDTGGGVWVDVTASVGIPSVGVLAGIYDFDGDGLLDLLITDSSVGGIYRNTGVGGFVRQLDQLATDLALYNYGSTTLDGVYDFDEDGKADLVMVTARFGYESGVYQNVNNQYVRRLALGLGSINAGQCVVADFNNDGRLDLLALPNGGTTYPRLYLNRTPAAGNYVNVRLTGPAVNRAAVDALVEVYTAGYVGQAAYRVGYTRNNTVGSPAALAITGIGHSHGGNLPVHVGVGSASSVDIRVTYPGGTTATALAQSVNQTITIVS